MSDELQEDEIPARPKLQRRYFWLIFLLSCAGASVIALAPYALSVFHHLAMPPAHDPEARQKGSYGFSLMVLLPLLQGLFIGIAIARYDQRFRTGFWLGLLIFIFDFAFGYSFFGEGWVCMVMAFPLFLGLIWVGVGTGTWLSFVVTTRRLYASVIPLALLFGSYDVHLPMAGKERVVSDRIVIGAPPSAIWPYIASFPAMTGKSDYWLWHVGLPMPVQSVARSAVVGGYRQCLFTGHTAFGERITEYVPDKVMTYAVTEQPDNPEILGHFIFDQGRMALTPNADGTTTLTITGWYRLLVRPSGYFDLWAADIIRHTHYRTLEHIKSLAEQSAHKPGKA